MAIVSSQLPSSGFRDVEMDLDWLTSESLKYIDRPPIAGRMFGIKDPTRKEALVDENAAQELFGAKTPGMVIQDPFGSPVEVIGVVKRNPGYASDKNRSAIYYDYTDHLVAPGPTIRAEFRVPVSSPVNSELNVNVVSAGYFETLGMSLVAVGVFLTLRLAVKVEWVFSIRKPRIFISVANRSAQLSLMTGV